MRRMFVIISAALLLFTSSVATANVGWFGQITKTDRPATVPIDKPSSIIQSDYDTRCPAGSEIGKQLPILRVHGWNGQPRVWSPTDKLFSEILDTQAVKPFNYQLFNRNWVTHPGISGALSQKINCLADASRAGGGKGKVVIIAHSMGGLAARRALALGGAGKHVGLIITLGTPYKGSGWASNADIPSRNICRWINPTSPSCITSGFEGMSEHTRLISALPAWPKNVPVMAMAGDVLAGTNMNSDLAVTVDSALSGGQRADLGGGQLTYRCNSNIPAMRDAPCSHGNLPYYSPIQQQIKRSIQRYLASLRGPSVKIGDLRMWLKPGWKVNWKFSPGIRIEDTGSCYEFDGQRLCPYIIIFDNAKSPRGSETYCGRLKLAGFRKVGGKLSEFYRNTCHDGPANRALLDWFVPGKNIHIQSDNVPELSSWLEKNVAWE